MKATIRIEPTERYSGDGQQVPFCEEVESANFVQGKGFYVLDTVHHLKIWVSFDKVSNDIVEAVHFSRDSK